MVPEIIAIARYQTLSIGSTQRENRPEASMVVPEIFAIAGYQTLSIGSL